MTNKSSFTGQTRRRKTRASVRFADVLSKAMITVGGVGTIVAVTTVCLFLALVVLPLFLPAQTNLRGSQANQSLGEGPAVRLMVDEYRSMAYTCSADGTVTVLRIDNGEVLEQIQLFEGRKPTSWSFSGADETGVTGFADGSVQAFSLYFQTGFLRDDLVPEAYYALQDDEVVTHENGTVERTPEGQFRLQRLQAEMLGEPQQIGAGPIRVLTHASGEETLRLVALTKAEDGSDALLLLEAEQSENLFTGEEIFEYGQARAMPFQPRSGDPGFLRITGLGDHAFAVWPDGTMYRYRTADPRDPVFAEQADLLDDPGLRVTAMEFLLGKTTLLVGDSAGGLNGWFTATVDGSDSADGFELLHAKTLRPGDGSVGAVTSIRPATRRRMFAAGFAEGGIGVYYVTSADTMNWTQAPVQVPIEAVTITPKEDGILALLGGDFYHWDFRPGYPEASLASLFAPVWYEGYPEPTFMWQSSAATDEFEPKLSLIPLVFGTLKATIYSMLFGVPLALLAAIYTSEFLDPKWKQFIKPTIEMMASLPSVVLGFLAALVFAPYIERYLPATLACFFTIPLAFLIGALGWQLLPKQFMLRWTPHRIIFVAPLLPVGLLLALWAGPLMEQLLFGANLRQWLNGLHGDTATGSALGGWVVLLLPICAFGLAIVMSLYINPVIRRKTQRLARRGAALTDVAKFCIVGVATLLAAVVIGYLLTAVGLDLRKPMPLLGSIVDTYDQRNALVVGFVMAFAIIPIIYTIADDALSTVPEHLRAASLGAGATPWQTAVRIIIPTAMSGLFSAMMIGLGRAVGETMIVLMAAGNTPTMTANPFEGFRTLSANIAVEMPEAPQGETHYRTLFLAALVLFAMTFVVNTVAEAVRLRFRKRAYQL
jgi:phosphate transport system permease protein